MEYKSDINYSIHLCKSSNQINRVHIEKLNRHNTNLDMNLYMFLELMCNNILNCNLSIHLIKGQHKRHMKSRMLSKLIMKDNIQCHNQYNINLKYNNSPRYIIYINHWIHLSMFSMLIHKPNKQMKLCQRRIQKDNFMNKYQIQLSYKIQNYKWNINQQINLYKMHKKNRILNNLLMNSNNILFNIIMNINLILMYNMIPKYMMCTDY